jgi:hypothetical protein
MSGQNIRAKGFYWVKDDEDWYIAEWDRAWWVNGMSFKDEDFKEIDENRIMRDAERLAIYLEAKKIDKLNE